MRNELKRLGCIKPELLRDALFTNIKNETSSKAFLTRNTLILHV